MPLDYRLTVKTFHTLQSCDKRSFYEDACGVAIPVAINKLQRKMFLVLVDREQ